MTTVLVLGAGGFIGDHLVSHHNKLGHDVYAVDLVYPAFNQSKANHFIQGDLRDASFARSLFGITSYDIVYHFAADMGGAGYIFTGDNDADIMSNNLKITLNVLDAAKRGKQSLIFASSACVYPAHNQVNKDSITIDEASAYPADPDSDYGWEKLTSERLCQAYRSNYGMDNKIVRIHNVYGPRSCYNNGKEKAPAAICRKVIESDDEIVIWGDGKQVRSFLYIDDFIAAIDKINHSNIVGPINVGSTESIAINDLAQMVIDISGKKIKIKNIPGPVGVNARNSNNSMIESLCDWHPNFTLRSGMERLYSWIENIMLKGNVNHE